MLLFQECDTGINYDSNPPSKVLNRTLLGYKLPPFLKNFDNPCWIECLPVNRTHLYADDRYSADERWQVLQDKMKLLYQRSSMSWRLRCLPKFYLIGMAKSGTTDLFARYVLNNILLLIHTRPWKQEHYKSRFKILSKTDSKLTSLYILF